MSLLCLLWPQVEKCTDELEALLEARGAAEQQAKLDTLQASSWGRGGWSEEGGGIGSGLGLTAAAVRGRLQPCGSALLRRLNQHSQALFLRP